MLLTAAQHAYDPAEQDYGYGHAHEAGGHPLEVCKAHGTRERGKGFFWGRCQVPLHSSTGLRKGISGELTERVPLVLPYCLRQIDGQIPGEHWWWVVVFYWCAARNQSCGCKQRQEDVTYEHWDGMKRIPQGSLPLLPPPHPSIHPSTHTTVQ